MLKMRQNKSLKEKNSNSEMAMIVNSCADLPIKMEKADGRRKWPLLFSFYANPVKTKKVAHCRVRI